MTSAITLDFIREAADKEYGNFSVSVDDGAEISLANPLRMSKERRAELSALNADEFEDPIDYFEAAFAVASTKAEAKRIRKALGDEDAALYATLFKLYTKGVELGEASPSQD